MKKPCLVLVGMSNLGKSHKALLLEGIGYTRLCVDDEIGKLLIPDLINFGNVSKWIGHPFEPRYRRNSTTYLENEIEIMWGIVPKIRNGHKVVIDTTGSVIYTGGKLLGFLKAHPNVTIVLLDAPIGHQEDLYRRFLAEPKPILWGDGTYAPLPNEDPMAALARCYPDLLRTRTRRYKELAHVILEHQDYYDVTAEDFLATIEERMEMVAM